MNHCANFLCERGSTHEKDSRTHRPRCPGRILERGCRPGSFAQTRSGRSGAGEDRNRCAGVLLWLASSSDVSRRSALPWLEREEVASPKGVQ